MIARLLMLGDDPRPTRPQIAKWFARMQTRPSYVAADIWDHTKPWRLLGMFASKLWPVLLGLTLAIAALVWALIWALL